MLVILPIVLVIFFITTILAGLLSTRALKEQTRKNAELLSFSYASKLDAKITQYLDVAQDLGSAVITSIYIESTLQSFRRRYPEFSHVFYTPMDGKVLEMSPYESPKVG